MKTWVRLEAIRTGNFFGRDAANRASVELQLFSFEGCLKWFDRVHNSGWVCVWKDPDLKGVVRLQHSADVHRM